MRISRVHLEKRKIPGFTSVDKNIVGSFERCLQLDTVVFPDIDSFNLMHFFLYEQSRSFLQERLFYFRCLSGSLTVPLIRVGSGGTSHSTIPHYKSVSFL